MADSAGESYYSDNYADYDRQTSERKLAFYRGLLENWLRPGCRLFELGVGMSHFLGSVFSKYDCFGCEVNRYGLEAAGGKKFPRSFVARFLRVYAGETCYRRDRCLGRLGAYFRNWMPHCRSCTKGSLAVVF